MFWGENSDSIPIDLVHEIFLRLPMKSIGRCRCVSKQWESMLSGQYFTGLFLRKSSAQPPRLLFAVQRYKYDEWSFFSSPQPQNLYDEKSLSLSVDADFHSKFLIGRGSCNSYSLKFCGQASGLICCRQDYSIVICNPSTGQRTSIPPRERSDQNSFLGFDPIDNKYKVLSIGSHNKYDKNKERFQILTLEKGNFWWRKIWCPLDHSPAEVIEGIEGICINGVLYYLARQINDDLLIVCFDVKSEKFKFIDIDFIVGSIRKLINYKGKLGLITDKLPVGNVDYQRRFSLKLCMWIVNEKPESSKWSEYFSTSWDVDYRNSTFSVVGVTATGEIVLSSTNEVSKQFNVIYLNPERNTRQSVEIRGFGANYQVRVFVDYVEDFKFIKLKKRDRFVSINKFDILDEDDDDDEFT